MAKCKNCKNLRREHGLCEWCHCIEDSPDIERDMECEYYKAMTNADSIRNMTDEELANMLFCGIKVLYDNSHNRSKVLEWMQSESKKIMINKEYEEYLNKYARDRKISVEEAVQHAVVKEYKKYLEERI